MKDTIKVGMSATRRIEVDTARTIDFLGENLRVYATPELVRDFEIVSRPLPDRGGIHHRRVKPEAVEIVPEIVVELDILARTAL